MSEIKLNLLDSHTLLTATVHGSVGDALVAALSAEPETIDELETALKRFEKCESIPASSLSRRARGPIDKQPWDAGILVIDLPARMVACESTYSLPTRRGTVDNRVVFNICGNKYRLVVKVNYPYRVMYIRFLGTHAQYDRIDAEEV